MSRTGPRPLQLVFLIPAILCSSVAYGQLPPRLQRCLPYPTFADEVHASNEQSSTLDTSPRKETIVVDHVIFDPASGLSNSARDQVLMELKKVGADMGPDLIAEVIRAAWQDQGYFKVQPNTDFRTISSDAISRHVALTIHVNEGPQFFLGGLEIRSADPDEPLVFSSDELRHLVPLQEGDVFDADRIRQGLDALRKFYGVRGYLDFLAEPEFDVDDARHLIWLTVEVDHGKQVRIRHVEVLGLDSATEKALRAKIKPGDVFDVETIEQFFKESRAALPIDASMQDVDLEHDVKNGTIDMTFDFYTCP